MNIEWQLFTKDNSEDSINKIFDSVTKKINIPVSKSKIESSKERGVIIELTTPISEESWSLAVVRALAIGQKIGRAWHLSGNIEIEVDAWSNESEIPGITALHLMLFPNESV